MTQLEKEIVSLQQKRATIVLFCRKCESPTQHNLDFVSLQKDIRFGALFLAGLTFLGLLGAGLGLDWPGWMFYVICLGCPFLCIIYYSILGILFSKNNRFCKCCQCNTRYQTSWAETKYQKSKGIKASQPRSARIIFIVGLIFLFLSLAPFIFGQLKYFYIAGIFIGLGSVMFLVAVTIQIITNIIRAKTTRRKLVLISISSLGYLATFVSPFFFSLLNEVVLTLLIVVGIILIIISYKIK